MMTKKFKNGFGNHFENIDFMGAAFLSKNCVS